MSRILRGDNKTLLVFVLFVLSLAIGCAGDSAPESAVSASATEFGGDGPGEESDLGDGDPDLLARAGSRESASEDRGSTAADDPVDFVGTVIDPRDNQAVEGALVTITFADGGDAGINPVTTDAEGLFEFTGDFDSDYKIVVENLYYYATELWTTQGCLGTENTLPTLWIIPEPVITQGDLQGVIKDVMTGFKIPGATVEFRAGLNPPETAEVVYTATTGNTAPNRGEYTVVGLEAGVYTGFVSKNASNYVPNIFYTYVLGGDLNNNQNGTLSEAIQEDQMRIILTWGFSPSDLDSHFWAPCPYQHPDCEYGQYHVAYYNNGAHPFVSYFDLDLDDVTSWGPETTTIYNPSPTIGEVYNFLVHDYSNLGCYGSYCTDMTNSDSHQVQIITGGGCVQTFTPIPNTAATVWHVFDAVFDGASWEIIPIDEYCFESTPGLVGPTCS